MAAKIILRLGLHFILKFSFFFFSFLNKNPPFFGWGRVSEVSSFISKP